MKVFAEHRNGSLYRPATPIWQRGGSSRWKW
jgi:hypothetical protein